MSDTDWTPDRINDLRNERGQTQTEFGLDLYATTEGTAQKLVSDLERGEIQPGGAVVRTLQRMERGEEL